MKRFLIALSLAVMVVGCAEDEIGQRATDSTPPKSLDPANVQVENVPGGANLIYALPDDEDIAFVEATYTTNRGTEKTRSSVYNDTLKIRGFGDVGVKPITLTVFDRSHNASSSIVKEISPDLAPIYSIAETMVIEAAFGGVKIVWENPNADNVIVKLYRKDKLENIEQNTYATASDDDSKVDENGEPKFYHVETMYTNRVDGLFKVRGMKDIEAEFAIEITDRWSNKTPLENKIWTLTPIFEMRIPNKPDRNFTITKKMSGDTGYGYGWEHRFLTDDNLGENGYHTEPGSISGPWPHRVTVTFKKPVKISRMKIFHRPGWYYKHGNPKQMYIYGYTDATYPNITTDDDSWINWMDPTSEKVKDWYFYGVYNSIKPSGLTGLGEHTGEDKAYMDAGEDFEVQDLNSPHVYFVKFVCFESWGGSELLHMCEIQFWGSVEGVTNADDL